MVGWNECVRFKHLAALSVLYAFGRLLMWVTW
jgi:hypothetical protein